MEPPSDSSTQRRCTLIAAILHWKLKALILLKSTKGARENTFALLSILGIAKQLNLRRNVRYPR